MLISDISSRLESIIFQNERKKIFFSSTHVLGKYCLSGTFYLKFPHKSSPCWPHSHNRCFLICPGPQNFHRHLILFIFIFIPFYVAKNSKRRQSWENVILNAYINWARKSTNGALRHVSKFVANIKTMPYGCGVHRISKLISFFRWAPSTHSGTPQNLVRFFYFYLSPYFTCLFFDYYCPVSRKIK